MATGETVNITSDLTLTGKFEMTKYDDTLNIIDVTVTLSEPAGDLFTNEGNDTVTVTGSTLTATSPAVSFMLGSGDDTLILNNSTIDAPTLTGTGNDVVRITGERQSQVTLNAMPDEEDHSLSLGGGDDVLELLNRSRNDTQEVLCDLPSDLMTPAEIAALPEIAESEITEREIVNWTKRRRNPAPCFRLNKQTRRIRRSSFLRWIEESSRIRRRG